MKSSSNLADKLSRGPLSLSEAIRIFTPIGEALDALHGHGILHGHLKPGSILFDEVDIPSLGESNLATPGAPEYMSPEEVRGQPLDARADVYSLAALVYHALTGRPPFEGATQQGIMFKQATQPPRPPRELRPDLPEAIDAVLLKGLAKQPDDRYQSATEFVHALSAVAESRTALETVQPAGPEGVMPVTAGTPSPGLEAPGLAPQAEAAPMVMPPPAGQGTAVNKRGLGTRLIIAAVAVLALCLCAWFVAALYESARIALAPPLRVITPTLFIPEPTSEPAASIWFWSADYSPDGKHVVTSHDDNSVRVWDAETGKQLAMQPGRGETREAVYSPDGTRILTTDGNSEGHEYYASVWDATLEKELVRLSGHTSPIFRARFDPQGKQIATASEDGTARIWDAATGTQRLFLVEHDYWILEPIYSPDGKQIVTRAESQHMEAWDAANGEKLASFSAWSAAYSPDSKRIVMARDDNTAWVWDTMAWTKLLVLTGHTDKVWGASYSPDGKQIVTYGKDRTARIWDAETGKELAVLAGHTRAVSTAIYSPDGRYIVTATYSDPPRVWDAQSGELVRMLGSNGDGVDVAVFSPDGKHLFTGNEDGTAHVWDTTTWSGVVSWETKAAPATPLPPQATATAQAAQALLDKTAQWHILLSDPFDRAANGWTVDSFQTPMGKVSNDIVGGKYKWTLSANQPLVNRDIPNVKTAANYVVGVEGRRVSGPNTCGYGVSLHDDYHSFYLMAVNDDRTWSFGRAETYAPLTPLAQGSSPAIKSGDVNRVQVVAQGDTYTLFVNDAFVGEVRDAALAGISLGIGAEVVKAGDVCEFEFDNFEVRAP